jgi:hypothetical protein
MFTTKAEYEAAVVRANALSDAPEGTPEARELALLIADLREWDEHHKGDQSHGPEPVEGFNRPDDLPFSGLPGNLGKLTKD